MTTATVRRLEPLFLGGGGKEHVPPIHILVDTVEGSLFTLLSAMTMVEWSLPGGVLGSSYSKNRRPPTTAYIPVRYIISFSRGTFTPLLRVSKYG